MSSQKLIAAVLSVGMVGLGSGAASGAAPSKDFPVKPVRIVTSEIGGGLDFSARMVALGISGPLGQQVIVDNRGGSGVLPMEMIAKAQPDGYSLLLFGSTIWLLPFLKDKVPYDPVKDFTPVTLAAQSPLIVVVNPAVPVGNIKELIALAKAKPGVLNYGSGALGSQSHLAPELFKAMAKVDFVRVAYKGSAPAVNALIAGEVQVMFVPMGGVAPHLKTGRLKSLAVTGAQASLLAPGVPTVTASGLPGYESVSVIAIFAPSKTPPAIVKKLNEVMVSYLHSQDGKDRFLASGVEAVGSTPEELGAMMKGEMARMGKVIKDAGIHEQ